jgi:hypothetical protein
MDPVCGQSNTNEPPPPPGVKEVVGFVVETQISFPREFMSTEYVSL